jgi:hypothetical protein
MTETISAKEEMAANLAFIHKKEGIDGLREVLEAIATARSSVASYETFADLVVELRETGLLDAANDLDQLAREMLPREWQLPCPHLPDCTNLIKEWQQEMEKKKKGIRE